MAIQTQKAYTMQQRYGCKFLDTSVSQLGDVVLVAKQLHTLNTH